MPGRVACLEEFVPLHPLRTVPAHFLIHGNPFFFADVFFHSSSRFVSLCHSHDDARLNCEVIDGSRALVLTQNGCQSWTRTNTERLNRPPCYFHTTWQWRCRQDSHLHRSV